MLVVLLCSPVISYSLGGVISYSLGGVRAHVHRRDDVVASTMQVFESDLWPALVKQLDRLPVFTVANAAGQPLEYQIDGEPTAMFYADVEAAKEELATARKSFPELDCDLIPAGVGSVYKLTCERKAMLLPATADLTAAGAPPDAPAMGQPLPLFTCLEMSQSSENGKPKLPLFMAWADCAAAVSQATQTDGPEDKLEIVGLSLPSVIERLSSLTEEEDGPAFVFIPSSASAKHIAEYIANSGGPPLSNGGS